MAHKEQAPIDKESMVQLVSTIFADLNIGMLIYQLEEPGNASSLRLLYANEAASHYTGADLTGRVGKRILEAFPALKDSDIPQSFHDIAHERRSRNLGSFEYDGDKAIERSHYAIKAFPMPSDCVGVAFENISVRKKVSDLVRQRPKK
ncbi:MAG: hypothetical protein HKN43_10150 [Rhodothermales bacterium]|nr:hypothetical protein [Rhodothermales bacterium]